MPPRDALRTLSIFHYVLAGFTALFSCLPLVYVALGALFLSGTLDGKDPPPPFVGWVVGAFGMFLLLLVVGTAVLLFLAGRCLARARGWTFCVVVAALSCLNMPFGTLLGVFTLVTLMKPEVKALFPGPAAPAARPTSASGW